MNFSFLSLSRVNEALGVVVVIDVLRAFTTAAFAFHNGAKKIIPVGTTQEAFELRNKIPGSMLMGEEHGYRPKGFDFGNSPAEIINQDLSNKTLIQRTSAGTQGLVRSKTNSGLLAASFVVADATAEYLKALNPEHVSFIITGNSLGRDGDEDLACAEFIAGLVQNNNLNSDPYTYRILTSSVGRSFLNGENKYLSEGDLILSSQVNRFSFSMIVKKEDDLLVIFRNDQ